MTVYGYIRISTKDQSIERQKKSLIEYGVPEENIFVDVMSGKSFDRPEYQKLKSIIQNGDTIIFHELDRLGRNFKEGKEEVDYFQKRNIKLIFLDMEFLNSMMENNDIMVRLMGYIQVLVALAIGEKEREKIRKRQREGIELAKIKGKYTGRKRKFQKVTLEDAFKKYESGEYTVKDICEIYQMSRSTFYRRLKEYQEKQISEA
jgi:DNA invertase Pin-like site-specific DNA recombinase